MGEAGAASAGTPFGWCQSPEVSAWLLLWTGQTRRRVVPLGPCQRGQLPSPTCPGLAQTLLAASHPNARNNSQAPHLNLMEKTRIML